MFEKSGSFRSKFAMPVTMQLAGHDAFEGAVYVRPDERLMDLLNDDRKFIPVIGPDDEMMIIAKTNIVSIIERQIDTDDQAENQADEEQAEKTQEKERKTNATGRGFDPYATLRVGKNDDL